MDLVARAQGLILKPKEEWVKIKGEDTAPMALFTGYAALLAPIPAIAQFIGVWPHRHPHPVSRHPTACPSAPALVGPSSITFSAWPASTRFGLIINALAPNFGSKPNPENAMKLAVYSMTIAFVAGIFYIIPSLGVLAGIAGLYGLYVLYLGFNTPMMDTPKDKVIGYLVVSSSWSSFWCWSSA